MSADFLEPAPHAVITRMSAAMIIDLLDFIVL
jgi:hypothetical protein